MSLEGQRIPLEDIRTAYFPRGNFVRDAVVGLVGSSIVLGALEHAGIIQKTPVEKLLSSREYLLSPVLKTVIPYAPIVGTLNAGDSDAAGTRAVSAVSIIANDVDTIGGDWSDIIATATAGKTIDHLVSVQLQDPRIEEMRISQPNRQAFLSAMQNDMGHAIFGDRQCQESMRFLESVPDAFQKFLQLKDLKNIPAELFEVGKNVVQLANRLDEFFSESKEKLVYAIEQLFGVLNPQSLTLLGFLPLEYARFIEYLPPGDNQKTLRFPVEGNPFREWFVKQFVDWGNTELVSVTERIKRRYQGKNVLFIPVSEILKKTNFPYEDPHTDKLGQTIIAHHIERQMNDNGTTLYDKVHKRPF